ncbi:MAG TPA: alpha/beta fold hydrolase [Rhodanobacteraceae bacterium]|nr:alpha/beta fold hydrolase [Rhodanobacteraceae bacterium]
MNAADFRPRAGLRNAHVQSLLGSIGLRRWLFARRRAALEGAATAIILDCGEGVRLQGFHTPQRAFAAARGLVVLLHGWEGSVQSSYLLHAGARLLDEGFDVFRLNFRDHGVTHHLNRGIFHSCRIDEVVGAVGTVAARFAQRPLAIAGFSLGGNFALRVALRAPAAGIPLAYALAINPVIDPAACLAALETAPWFYQRYFLRKWRGSLRRKQTAFPGRELFTRAELSGNLRELTRSLVLRHTDFGSLENYLDGYSIAGERLSALRVPATLLAAADDPIIPLADFRRLTLPPQVELQIADHGGHCGYLRDLSLRSWSEDFVAERMLRHLVAV